MSAHALVERGTGPLSVDSGSVVLSVCVIGRNEGRNLARAAESLHLLRDIGARWESIFVDSASTDDSVTIAEPLFDRVVCLAADDRLNAGAARHIGTLHSTGEWILYLDGDMQLHAEIVPAIAELVRRADTNSGLSGLTENHYPDGMREFIRINGNHDGRECREFGGAVLLPRTCVLAAGNWSCAVFAYEESELYSRLRRHGARVHWHAVRMVVHHTPRFEARRKLVGSLWPRGSHLGKKFFGAGQVTRFTLAEGNFLSFVRVKWEPYLMLSSLLLGLGALPWLGLSAVIPPFAALAINAARLGLRGAANYACWPSQMLFGWFRLDRAYRPSVVAVLDRRMVGAGSTQRLP